ncbi:MAG: NAD(P)/FAD-dependent oxidoreductase [Dehalococcoidia bacterium]|nr:NAD(P)/FAD-dependent oxidoreductase [Dehalococcoidia bacterium]
MYDVIVIGAGIIGSYTAKELARLGHSVAALEKNPEPGCKTSCTGIVSQACLDMLPGSHSAIQREARSATVFSPDSNHLRIKRETTQAYILDRMALDRLVAEQAGQTGVEYFFSTPAIDLQSDDRGVHVNATRDARPLKLSARACVIACGTAPGLIRQLGMGRIRQYAHGAQTEVSCKNIDEVEVYSGRHFAPGFFAWLVPTMPGKAKAGLLSSTNPGTSITNLLRYLERQGKIQSASHYISYGSIPLKPLTKTYNHRILVVGDAAGQVKPTTGGGIYFGLICAGLAAQTLDESLRAGDLSARRLALYQKRWHKILKHELDIDYWAHRFYQGLTDKQVDHIFQVILRHGIHESLLASPDITFDWHGKVIVDAIRHRSLQRSLEKFKLFRPPA